MIHRKYTYRTLAHSLVFFSLCMGSACSKPTPIAEPPVAAVAIVQGDVRYQDKEYSQAGFSDVSTPTYKPVRFALVELLDAAGQVVQTSSTDATGHFTFASTARSALIGGKLRILAKTDVSSGISVEIQNMTGNLFAVTLPLTESDIEHGITADIGLAGSVSGAFNITDVYTLGAEFVHTLNTTYPPKLTVYWQPGNASPTAYCAVGNTNTYVCPRGAGIYVYNDNAQGDTDEYDDDVLWHEYGHFVAANFFRDDSPGGCHLLTSDDLDLRLAWSEGWGDFFPTAIKSWLVANNSKALSTPLDLSASYYIDTAVTGVRIAVDIENPNGDNSDDPYMFATNELAVANVLWRLTKNFGLERVWSIVKNHMSGANGAANLESFWKGWKDNLAIQSYDLSISQRIFDDRKIYYKEDLFEDDDVPRATRVIASGVEEQHYLYKNTGVGDVDTLILKATKGAGYTVETYGLRNGADTLLRIKDSSGNLLVENDDFNNTHYVFDRTCGGYRYQNTTTSLASKLEFLPLNDGDYTVEISNTADPSPYPSTGRFGSYQLMVTPQ